MSVDQKADSESSCSSTSTDIVDSASVDKEFEFDDVTCEKVYALYASFREMDLNVKQRRRTDLDLLRQIAQLKTLLEEQPEDIENIFRACRLMSTTLYNDPKTKLELVTELLAFAQELRQLRPICDTSSSTLVYTSKPLEAIDEKELHKVYKVLRYYDTDEDCGCAPVAPWSKSHEQLQSELMEAWNLLQKLLYV